MTNQEQNRHRSSCRCNACVARRNARRRLEEDRYRAAGRPLPQRSQVYEIARNLPPVYEGEPVESLTVSESARSVSSWSIPPSEGTTSDEIEKFLSSRAPQPTVMFPRFPAPTHPQPRPVKKRTRRIAEMVTALAVITLIGIIVWWQWVRIGQLIESAGK